MELHTAVYSHYKVLKHGSMLEHFGSMFKHVYILEHVGSMFKHVYILEHV